MSNAYTLEVISAPSGVLFPVCGCGMALSTCSTEREAVEIWLAHSANDHGQEVTP